MIKPFGASKSKLVASSINQDYIIDWHWHWPFAFVSLDPDGKWFGWLDKPKGNESLGEWIYNGIGSPTGERMVRADEINVYTSSENVLEHIGEKEATLLWEKMMFISPQMEAQIVKNK